MSRPTILGSIHLSRALSGTVRHVFTEIPIIDVVHVHRMLLRKLDVEAFQLFHHPEM